MKRALENPRYVALAMSILGILVSTIFLMLFRIDSTTPFALGAAIGDVVQAVVETGQLEVVRGGKSWFAAKMPALPYLYAALWSLTHSVWAMVLIKNIALSAFLVVILFSFARHFEIPNKRISLCLILIFAIPFNLMTMMTLSYEEAILSFLIPVTFALALMSPGVKTFLGIAVLVSVIYLTKSSAVLFCVWIALCAVITASGVAWPMRLLPLAALSISALVWAAHIKYETGRFAIGSHSTSNNGKNFYKGNNP